MTQPSENASPLPNVLHGLHETAGAEFQPYGEIEIVSTFGEPQAEYAAIRKGAALLDEPQRGVLELTGPDRLAFLNSLLTQQTYDKSTKSVLAAGEGRYAFFLHGNGRIAADMHVLERGDRTWLVMDARLIDTIRQSFDKYLFREQVAMTSRVGALHSLSVHGPSARAVLSEAAGADLPDLTPFSSAAAELLGIRVVLWRDDPCGVPGFEIVVESSAAAELWTKLLARFNVMHEHGRRKLRPAGWAAFNATRIEAGRPIFGIDFDDSVLPAETGLLEHAVSFTKGCYLGQEIVARMHARGQRARQIVGIRVSEDALPLAGALLYDDQDNQVGGVTSSTVSPLLSNACIGLALVKKGFIAPGSKVKVPAEGKMREAVVVDLPFLKAPGNEASPSDAT